MTSQTNTITGAPSYTTNWAYDAMDRPTSMTYPGGEVVTSTYATQGLNTVLGYASNAFYNTAGQLTSVELGDTRTLKYVYDPQNLRLTQLGATGLISLTYQYDKVGNIKTITDTVRGEVTGYTYDELDRLTSASLTGASPYTQRWGYNAIGNIITSTLGATTSNYSYSAPTQPRPHAVTQVGSQTYQYDADGNMTSRPGATLSYDAENRLTQDVTASSIITNTYDGDGTRVRTTVSAGGTVTNTYYVGNYYEVMVVGGNTTTTKYYYFGAQRIAMRVGNSNTVSYLYGDSLGSTSAVSTDGVIVTQAYYAYGEVRTGALLTDGKLPTDYTFTGQRKDAASGLMYYGARYYDSIGRFAQPDTIIPDPYNPQSLNRYSYVRNNPVRYTDPTGHCERSECPQNYVRPSRMGAWWDPPLKASYRLDNVPNQDQRSLSDNGFNACGPAALYDLMKWLNKPDTYEEVANELKKIPQNQGGYDSKCSGNPVCTSGGALAVVAKDHDLTVDAGDNWTIDSLQYELSQGHPVIVDVNITGSKGNLVGHFIVVTGIDMKNQRIYFNDPDGAHNDGLSLDMGFEEFRQKWGSDERKDPVDKNDPIQLKGHRGWAMVAFDE